MSWTRFGWRDISLRPREANSLEVLTLPSSLDIHNALDMPSPVSRIGARGLVTWSLIFLLALTLIVPIVYVVRGAFVENGRFTLVWFSDVLSDSITRRGLWNSVLLAILTTAGCQLIAIPLAVIADELDFAGKRLWLLLIQVPLLLPPFVGALGLKAILSRNGGLNAVLGMFGIQDPAASIDWLASPFASCVILEMLYLYPIAFLNIQAVQSAVDPALDEAARDLGAGFWRRFVRIKLPMLRPGIFAGSTIVFVWAFTELGTPLMVGFRDVAPVQVFTELQTINPLGDTYALVCLVLAISTVAYAIGKVTLGRSAAPQSEKRAATAERRRCGLLGSAIVSLPFLLVFLAASLPHLGVLLLSLSATGMVPLSIESFTLAHHAALWSQLAGASSMELAGTSIANSFKLSIMATAIDIILGFAIAYVVVRNKGPAARLLDGLAMLPLAVPGLVLAFGYFAISQLPMLSFANPIVASPIYLLVLAYGVRRLPFLVRSIAAGLEQSPPAFEEAAHDLGAGRFRTLLRITIPLVLPGIIAGSMLVFSRSMLEVSDSLILAFDQEDYPMTKAIWALTALPDSGIERSCALGVWGMVLLLVSISAASMLLGRRLGSAFRI